MLDCTNKHTITDKRGVVNMQMTNLCKIIRLAWRSGILYNHDMDELEATQGGVRL